MSRLRLFVCASYRLFETECCNTVHGLERLLALLVFVATNVAHANQAPNAWEFHANEAKQHIQEGDYIAGEVAADNALKAIAANKRNQAGMMLPRAFVYTLRARVLIEQNRLNAALADLDEAIKLFAQIPKNVDEATFNLARAYSERARIQFMQKQFEQSERSYEQGLEIFRALQQKHPGDTMLSLTLWDSEHNFGRLYLEWNRNAQDLGLAKQKLQAAYHARFSQKKKNADLAGRLELALVQSEYNLGLLEMASRDLVTAQKYVDNQLKRIKLNKELPPSAAYNAHYSQANLRRQSGKNKPAYESLDRAIESAEKQRSLVGMTSYNRGVAQELMISASERLMEWKIEDEEIDDVFVAIENARGKGFAEDMAINRQAFNNELTKLYLPARRKISVDPERYLLQKQEERPAKGRQEMERVYGAYRQARHSASQIAGKAQQNNPADDLAKIETWATDTKTLILEYFVGINRSYLLAIYPNGKRFAYELELSPAQAKTWGLDRTDTVPLTSDVLGHLWENERKDGIYDILAMPLGDFNKDRKGNTAKTKQLMVRLGDLLLPAKIQEGLASGTLERVLVVPDGRLAVIPFEALRITANGSQRSLIEFDMPFSYAPSIDVFLQLQDRAGKFAAAEDNADAPVLLIDKEEFEKDHGPPWNDLGLVSDQSQKCKLMFADKAIRSSDEPESRCRQLIDGKRRQMVYFATHGMEFDEYENIFGSIKLGVGNKNDSSDDGRLEIPEVYGMDLSGCQIVVLTACRTNLGPAVVGELPWGFTRAFFAAGATRVISTNWDVDDLAASEITEIFTAKVNNSLQQNDFATVDYAKALHEAKQQRARFSPP
ncbi:MAG: CHAT domain-containing protein, partial [Planctomycetales bacterium]|nr:CHAT domain-containing protein [Planctomycetales bacterium]